MQKLFVLLLSVWWSVLLAQAQESVSAIRILPRDIVPGSVYQERLSTNTFVVRWTYTESGAKKMMAFWEQHAGEKVSTQIGSFESRAAVIPSRDPVTYATWKEGWLKWRTDKVLGISENDAEAIVAGLKRK